MTSSPSHVAVLVPSVRKAAEYLRRFDFTTGDEETFEETREIYVQGDEPNALLLMEAKETGSYQRALKKRGPGVHHLAIDVLDIDEYLRSLSGSGWFLHLNSLDSLKNWRTAYLARPGFPALIEVQEKKELADGPVFVQGVSLKFDTRYIDMMKSVGLGDIVAPTSNPPSLTIRGREIRVEDLF